MSHHALTLLAFADDLALIAISGWPLAAELRWRRRCARRERLAEAAEIPDAPLIPCAAPRNKPRILEPR